MGKRSDIIDLEYNSVYLDQRTVANIFNINLNNRVKVKDNVNYDIVGTYNINYYLTYNPTIDYSHPINEYITKNGYDVSIGYYNLVSGKSYNYRENIIYYGTSLIKTLDALYLYDNNLINDELRSHINKAISVSNNESHHYLVNYIGKDNLKNYGIKLGAYNTLNGDDDYGNTTVMDQMVYMKKLYEMSKDNSELKGFFINDYANHLKFNNIDVMHKYGYWNNYFHDVGIFLDEKPYIVIILTMHGNDEFYNIVKNISKQIYKYHKGEL